MDITALAKRGVLWAVENLHSSPVKHHSKSWEPGIDARAGTGAGTGTGYGRGVEIVWQPKSSPHSDNATLYRRDLDLVLNVSISTIFGLS